MLQGGRRVLELLPWMDQILNTDYQLLYNPALPHHHGESLDVRPDHEVQHGRLGATKERSSLPLQLLIHLLELGPDGGPVLLELLGGELLSHPPASGKKVSPVAAPPPLK